MPLPAEGLSPNANDKATQETISESIAVCMREGGKTQEQCAAIAYSMARKSTGKELGKNSQGG